MLHNSQLWVNIPINRKPLLSWVRWWCFRWNLTSSWGQITDLYLKIRKYVIRHHQGIKLQRNITIVLRKAKAFDWWVNWPITVNYVIWSQIKTLFLGSFWGHIGVKLHFWHHHRDQWIKCVRNGGFIIYIGAI